MDLFESVFGQNAAASPAPSLVNQSGGDLFSAVFPQQAPAPAPKPPETWFGEFTNSFGHGVDMMQQMGYGAGALASSWLGAEGAKQWFLDGYTNNEKEMEAHPETVRSLGEIDSFDKAIRYGLAATGEFLPLVAQNLISAGIGAVAGTAAEPGAGTIGGGITGLVAKKSVQRLLATEVRGLIGEGVEKELSQYLAGALEKKVLSKEAQALLTKQGEATAKQLGAESFTALSNVAIMQGALYGDLSKNDEVPESDKRMAATIGGFLAALPLTSVASSITKKFIPTATEEFLQSEAGKKAMAETSGYMTRFLTTGAKEMMTNFGHTSAAMFTQTAINVAAANWADPNTRWNFLHFSPDQWQQMLDATVRGGIGGAIVGGGLSTAAKMAHSSNPKVDSKVRDIFAKTDDLRMDSPEITPEHKALEAVQDRIGQLETDLNGGKLSPEDAAKAKQDLGVHQALEAQLVEKLFPEQKEPLVNQSSEEKKTPTEAPKEPVPVSTPDQAKIDDLRAFYAERMPKEEGVYADKLGIGPKVAEKQAEVDAHIESIAGGTEYGEKLKQAFTPHVVRMMAAEDVHLATDPDGKKSFAVDVDNNGKISLYVPREEFASGIEPEAMAKHLGGDVETAKRDYLNNTDRFVQHELAHVADIINLRNEHKSLVNQKESLRDFVNTRWAERGARMRDAENSLPAVAKEAYHFGEKGNLSDIQLGQELPRMAIEMARQGRTTEVTEAIQAANRNNGKLNAFFRDWIDTLKNVGQLIRKMIDPATANPELLKAYHDINQTLDKYGVLVNQSPESAPTPPAPKPEVVSQPVPAPQPVPTPAPKPTESTPVMLPSQAVAAEAPKPKTPYQAFRQTIKTSGAHDIARSFLDWQHSRGTLPKTKAEVKAAHLDLVKRAPNINLSLDRFSQLAKERLQTNESTSRQVEPTQKASVESLGPEGNFGHQTDLPSDSRGEGGFNHSIPQAASEAAKEAKPGRKLDAIRAHLAEHHPDLLKHFEDIVLEVKKAGADGEAVARLDRPVYPLRGEQAASDIREFNHAIYIPDVPNETTRKLAEERGVKVFFAGEEPPADHYIIDPSGQYEGHDLVNQNASVDMPVNIDNKLDEAKATAGIPETHSLESLGHHTIDQKVVDDLDARFGKNGWIIKSFSTEALQSKGVFFAEVAKKFLAQDPKFFEPYDTSELMVQKLHDIAPSNRESNIKILPGRELRVHILTDHDGVAHVIPFSTFWKLSVDEVESNKTISPLTLEGAEIRAAHDKAVEAIGSLPPEERMGQAFGMDLVRLQNGEWGVVENNPTDHNGMSGFFSTNPLSHDAYLAAVMGEHPIQAELARVVHDAVTRDGVEVKTDESLVNQKRANSLEFGDEFSYEGQKWSVTEKYPDRNEIAIESMEGAGEKRISGDTIVETSPERSEPAEKPAFSQRAEKEWAKAREGTMREFDARFHPDELKPGKSEAKERGGAQDFDHLSSSAMEYRSQPHTEALARAQREIKAHGFEQTISDLHSDPLLTKWDLAEHDEINGVPNATLTAIYQNVMQQINSSLGKLDRDGGSRAVRTWLHDSFATTEKQFRTLLLAPGRAASIAGKVDRVWNGAVARKSYVEPILGHLEKVLGKKGMRFVSMMGEQLNGLMRDFADRVVTRAEVTAELQRISGMAHTRKFQTEARKTAVLTEKRARRVVQKMAARMAEHVGTDSLGTEWADEAASRMVKQMNGLPASTKGKTEVEIFNAAVNQVVRENAMDAGLRVPNSTPGVPVESKLAAILKNDGLYRELVQTLHSKMMEEYKPEPGSEFAAQVDQYFNWMHNRSWSEGMVDSLVNKNLKEFETTFAEIARQHYGQTEVNAKAMREAVKKAMKDHGVENEGLLNQLIDDVDSSLKSHVEQARLDFFGSGTGVRDFLKSMQTTLAQKAKEHAMARSDVPERLADWLAEDFGIPDTKELPLASTLQDVMMRQYQDMLGEERKNIVERMVDRATETATPKNREAAQKSIQKILDLVNLGVFRDETAYKALQEKLDLPPFSEDLAKEVESLGEKIATAPNDRLKGEAMQDLSLLIASQKGVRPYDMFMSGLYVNLLSGTSTHAVNIASNASSLLGYVMTAATEDIFKTRGRNVLPMLNALFRAATGSAASEFRETLFTGHRLASSGEKFYPSQNILEMEGPVFKSSIQNPKLAKIAEGAAKAEHRLYRALGGQYVGRALNAMDVYFYKMAQEAAFAVKTGITETHEMRSSALMEAEKQLRQVGVDWNENRTTRRKRDILANQIINDWRLVNQNGQIDERLRTAWLESNHEALDATFRQDPQGLLGHAAKFIEAWTRGSEDSPNPIGKLLIPFTRIAASVTNQMLEWTPYGFVRWGVGHTFGEDFRLRDENGKVIGRDPKILIRASLGMMGSIALMGTFSKYANQSNPYLAVYDDGPKDPQMRRQMMDAGWRPKTIKVGSSYYNYSYTPFAMALGIMGRHFDDFRDGKVHSPTDIGLASSAVAMLQSVTHQSFLSGLTDFMSAVDSPNPEKNMSRLMARMATAPIEPNLVRQIDRWVNPTVQQAEGFRENFIREMPVVRNSLMPSLNIFGQQVKRDPGIDFLPGMERFLTMQKTDDPVLNVLSERQIAVPGFSKSSKLGDQLMTREQHYDYVQRGGPRVYQAIQAELPQLRAMNKEQAQERVNEIARKVKEQVRLEMRGL